MQGFWTFVERSRLVSSLVEIMIANGTNLEVKLFKQILDLKTIGILLTVSSIHVTHGNIADTLKNRGMNYLRP